MALTLLITATVWAGCSYHWPSVRADDGGPADAAPPVDGVVGQDTGADGSVHACGDGVPDDGEECDDGNLRSHDGCSSGCTTEVPTWSELPLPPDGPTPRGGVAMTYNSHTHRVQLHGGKGDHVYGDLWELDGNQWIEVMPPNAPEARFGHAIVYQANRGVTLLFAGELVTGYSGETWELNNSSWSNVSASGGTDPGAFSGHSMVDFPTASGVLLLYSGATWLFTDSWIDLAPQLNLGERTEFGMAFDPAREVVAVFGGFITNSPAPYRSDTWEFDGQDWSETTPGNSPPARLGHAMVYEESRKQILMFGGVEQNSELLDDMWEYDGTVWTPIPVDKPPSARLGFGMVYDRAHARIVLFGGWGNVVPQASEPLGDTWIFRWESDWPEEICGDESDADADGLASCADPDCDLRPCSVDLVCVTGQCGGP